MDLFPMISDIFMDSYFSLLMILCSLILFIVYGLEVPGKFPKEHKVAKWGGVVYLAIGLLLFILSRVAG